MWLSDLNDSKTWFREFPTGIFQMSQKNWWSHSLTLLFTPDRKYKCCQLRQEPSLRILCYWWGFFPSNKIKQLWALFGFNNTHFLQSITVLIHFHGNLLLPLWETLKLPGGKQGRWGSSSVRIPFFSAVPMCSIIWLIFNGNLVLVSVLKRSSTGYLMLV